MTKKETAILLQAINVINDKSLKLKIKLYIYKNERNNAR